MKKITSFILAGMMTLSFASAAFSDVPESHWAYGEISVCTENGLFADSENFSPASVMTKADALKTLSAQFKGSDFSAISAKDASSAITREEAAYIFAKAKGYEDSYVYALDKFSDKDMISDEYITEVRAAVANGLIFGHSDDTFRPKERLTRAEFAVLLYRALYGEDILNARREKAIEYMLKSTTLLWRPKTEITYTTKSHVTPEEADSKEVYTLYPDRIYSGVPYSHGGGSATSFLEYAVEKDENGIYVIDNLPWEAMSGGRRYSSVGNDCSSSITLAWSSVGQAFPVGSGVSYFIEKNGVYPINGYSLDYEQCRDTKAVIEENGEDIIFKAYANLRKGDAVIQVRNKDGKIISSHSRMVKSVDVLYLPDGSIDPDNSMIHMIEQTASSLRGEKTVYNEELGCDVYIIGTQQSFSFRAMLKAVYIPVTPRILFDPAPISDPVVTDSESIFNKDTVLKGQITSTWSMDNATMIISDKDGNEIQRCSKNTERDDGKYLMFDLTEFVTYDPSFLRGKIDLNELESGTYNCKLIMRLVTGEEITIRDFDFEI